MAYCDVCGESFSNPPPKCLYCEESFERYNNCSKQVFESTPTWCSKDIIDAINMIGRGVAERRELWFSRHMHNPEGASNANA